MISPVESSERILRKLLWVRHGCVFSNLYGDDGEMQCNKCGIDFLRDSPKRIQEVFEDKSLQLIKEMNEKRSVLKDSK